MIKSRLQIGEGPILDLFEGYGILYGSSDDRTEAPLKKRDSTSYAGQPGENTDPRTVLDVFDYKVEFIILCPNKDMESANAVIETFNKMLYTQDDDSDIRTYKEVTFYDDYKRNKIVGIPDPLSEPKEFYRRQDGHVEDCVVVDFTIHVSKPQLCLFNTSAPMEEYSARDLRNKWCGLYSNNTKVYTSVDPLGRVRSIVTRLYPGSIAVINTVPAPLGQQDGNAPSYIVATKKQDDGGYSGVIAYGLRNGQLDVVTYTATQDCWLIVNSNRESDNLFSVKVDRRTAQERTILTANLNEIPEDD